MEEQRKSEKALVPVLRFEGFNDSWEQRKLEEEVRFFSGLTYTPGNVVSSDGVLVLRSSNVQENEITFDDCVYVNPSIATSEPVRKGDIIVVVRNGSRALIGKHALIRQNIENAVVGAFMTGIRSHNPAFINALLSTPAFSAEIERNLGATINQITGYMFSNMMFDFPTVEEQNKIGSLFADLDHLIALHQREHDKLKTVKQSLLEKMFPKEGEDVPEIRFEGFTEPWEQRKFSDFVVASGIRNVENLDLRSYSVTNDRGFVPQDVQFENGGTMKDADKTNYWIVEPNSFAYNPARINVGSIGYQSTSENVIVSSLYEVFKADASCDDRFLRHWFKTPLFTQQIEMLQEGGVRLYFFFDKLLMSEIYMPSIGEQKLIGAQFDQLDNLITLHQRELEILKNLKKAMLEKMFV